MAVRHSILAILIGVVLAAAPRVHAQPTRETIQIGKDATALVVMPSKRGFGSAFCIDLAGLFITNDHVVADSDEDVTLVVRSGESHEKQVKAYVLKTDAELDLALLKARDEGPFPALKLGSDGEVVETDTIVAFGYPFGTALAVDEEKFPSISVNVGRITAMRKVQGELERIQVDAQLNPGNSGGPVIDKEGAVVGVVSTGIDRTGVSFAVPVSKLKKWLDAPIVLFTPPAVAFEQRHGPVEFPINVTAIGRQASDLSVQFSIGEQKRSVQAKHVADSKFLATIAPLLESADEASLKVHITLEKGQIEGRCRDADVRLGSRSVKLSQFQSLKRGDDGWTITTAAGKQATLSDVPSGTLQIELGSGITVPIELQRSQSVGVTAAAANYQVPYELTTMAGGKVIDRQRGFLRIGREGEIVEAAAGSDRPGVPRGEKTAITEPVVVDFSTPYDAFDIGADGKYIILLVRAEKKIVVVDTVTGKAAKVIDSPTEGDLIAAGRKHLYIISPANMMIQKWSLETFERERTARLDIAEAPKRALLGASSEGPLLLTGKTANFIDGESLKSLAFDGKLIGGEPDRSGYLLGASHDGNTFAGVNYSSSHSRYDMLRLFDDRAFVFSFGEISGYPRWVVPSADGSLMLTHSGIYTAYGRPIAASGLPKMLIPTVDPRYFLAMNFEDNKTIFTVAASADCQKVYQRNGVFPELVPKRVSSFHDVVDALYDRGNWRVQYIPWANVIVTLPKGNEKVILRRFDLLETLKDEGASFLFVESTPPREALAGETLDYQVHAQSSAGGLSFKLEDGPEGCTVSPKGRLKWKIPPDIRTGFYQTIVSVRDREGNETFHTFDVAVYSKAKLFTVE